MKTSSSAQPLSQLSLQNAALMLPKEPCTRLADFSRLPIQVFFFQPSKGVFQDFQVFFWHITQRDRTTRSPVTQAPLCLGENVYSTI